MGVTNDPADGFDVRSLAATYREGHVLKKHTHPWAQLIYAKTGLMNVETPDQVWFVPPTKAVWVPSRVHHRITFKGEVAMRTLYVSEHRAAVLQHKVQALEVSPLLSQLIVHIHSIGMLDKKNETHEHLASVLIDLICAAPTFDLVLPHPIDARASRMAEYLRAHTTDKRSLKSLASAFGASIRTMQRCFTEETGLSLDAWRQKARLVHAFAMLTAGESVSSAANNSGYESPSAFIVAFKKQFGVTPGRIETGID